jgi:hypothetical protein
MSKSVWLYVKGDDYAAIEFEENYNVSEIYRTMKENGVKRMELNSDTYIEVELLEFGEVDHEFVSFVLNQLCDYDQLKNECIYRVE